MLGTIMVHCSCQEQGGSLASAGQEVRAQPKELGRRARRRGCCCRHWGWEGKSHWVMQGTLGRCCGRRTRSLMSRLGWDLELGLELVEMR